MGIWALRIKEACNMILNVAFPAIILLELGHLVILRVMALQPLRRIRWLPI